MRRLLAAAFTFTLVSLGSVAPALAAQDAGGCEFSRGTSTCFTFTQIGTFDNVLKVGNMDSCYVVVPSQIIRLESSAHRGAPNSKGKELPAPYPTDTFTADNPAGGSPTGYCSSPDESISLAPR